jgi:hypothetical protein
LWGPKIVSELSLGIRRSFESENKESASQLTALGTRKGLGLNLGNIFPSAAASNVFNLIPSTSYSGLTNAPTLGFGTRFGMPGQDVQATITTATTFIFGRHTLKVGAFFNHGRDIEGKFGSLSAGSSVYGGLSFCTSSTFPQDSKNVFANQLLGNFCSYGESNTRYDLRSLRYIFEWFAQDTWKVSRKLTLDYGVRFSWSTPFYPDAIGSAFNLSKYDPSKAPRLFQPAIVNGVRVAYDSITKQALDQAYIGAYVPNTGNILNGIELYNDPGVPRGFKDQPPIQVLPRFGFAYDVFGNGKLAIRGGGGVFVQTQQDGFWSGMGFVGNPPVLQLVNMSNANVSVLEGGSTATAYSMPAAVTMYERKGVLPVTYNFSLGVQGNIGHGMIADVKYAGTLGRHLAGPRTLNALPFGARFLPQNQDPTNPGFALPDNLIRPLPGWGNISITERRGSSNYNSLQATLNRQFSKNFQFGIAYTFSKSMDYGSDDRGFTSGFMSFPNFLPMRRNYGMSSFDQTHVFVANWQYNVPSLKSGFAGALTKEWQLSGIYSASSGQPQSMFLIALTDYLGGGDAGRVNLTCNPVLPRDQRTDAKFFNTGCISLPARGDIGSAPRNIYRGPGRNNWDMTLFRNFKLGSEERVLTFRWEVYNLFNHTQFSSIDNTILYLAAGPAILNLNSTFGQALGAASPRQMQFSLRFRF